MKTIALILTVFALNMPVVMASDFSSPAAEQSYAQSGDMSVQPDVAALAESFAQSSQVYQITRTTGCSDGCSSGCSGGCSMGCSSGCSMGCSTRCGY